MKMFSVVLGSHTLSERKSQPSQAKDERREGSKAYVRWSREPLLIEFHWCEVLMGSTSPLSKSHHVYYLGRERRTCAVQKHHSKPDGESKNNNSAEAKESWLPTQNFHSNQGYLWLPTNRGTCYSCLKKQIVLPVSSDAFPSHKTKGGIPKLSREKVSEQWLHYFSSLFKTR